MTGNNRLLASFLAALVASTGCASSAYAATGPMCLKRPAAHVLGAVDEESVANAIKYLDEAKAAGEKSITLRINSPGGSVWDGLELSQHIEALGVPVRCEVDGMAASMAAFILMSCNTRVMTARSTIMIHEPSLGGLISGNEVKFRNIAERLRVITSMLIKHSAVRMKMTEAQLRAKIDGGREFWMDSDEAVKYGAVDLVRG